MNKITEKIGKKIKTAREQAGLSQKELANKLNISKKTLINYEKGLTEPKLSVFLKIAEICNVSPSWLADESENKPECECIKVPFFGGDLSQYVGYLQSEGII